MADTNKRRLAAILAADAAGYSRLMAQDEAGALATLDAARAAFRTTIESNQGRVVDMAGDSVLAVFETAKGAVQAAIAAQARLDELGRDVFPDRRMDFRIGVHLGDLIEKPDGTVYGNGVNVAARLQSLAEPGQIWVSDAVRTAATTAQNACFEDQGQHHVKNIAEPVHAFRLGAAAAGQGTLALRIRRRASVKWALGAGVAAIAAAATVGLWLRTSSPHPSAAVAQGLRAVSLALAPIDTPAGDERAAVAAEQLRRDVAAGLVSPSYRQMVTLLTLPDAAASATPSLPIERARTAGARYLLEGHLQRDGDRHRAVLNLIEIESGAQKWSGDWPPRGASGAAPARALVETIAGAVMDQETRRVLPLPVETLMPVELCLRGSAVYDSKPTLSGIDEALPFAERALRLNPDFVPALNLKAFLLLNRYDEEVAPDHDRYARELDTLTARMLSIDSRDLYSWDLRAHSLMHAGRWASAAEAVEKMFQIEGPTAFSLLEKAGFWLQLGRPVEALDLMSGEPLQSSSQLLGSWSLTLTCHARLLLDDPGAAVEACEKAVGGDPRIWSVHLYLAAAQAQMGHMEQARASLRVVDRMSPGHTIARLRNYRQWSHPAYQRLAEGTYYAGLRKAGLPER